MILWDRVRRKIVTLKSEMETMIKRERHTQEDAFDNFQDASMTLMLYGFIK